MMPAHHTNKPKGWFKTKIGSQSIDSVLWFGPKLNPDLATINVDFEIVPCLSFAFSTVGGVCTVGSEQR